MDASWALGTLFLSLRIGPLFVLAPPFSQILIPMRVRLCLVLALSATLQFAGPGRVAVEGNGALLVSAASELFLGLMLAYAFQMAFAALAFAGRVLDVQAGYGLAMIIDPGSSNQAPMFGSILTLVGGVVFFTVNGHLELLRLLASLLHVLPLGQPIMIGGPGPLIGYMGLVMGMALGSVAATMVTLFLIDLTIAYLSRALPQMNALMLGLQVKTIATLIVVALTTGLVGAVILRLIRTALDFVPSLDSP